MLPKSKRLNLKRDFKFVASGKREETKSLKLFYLFGDNSEPLIGIALTKKFFPKSHDRNKVKRLVSSAVEAVYGNLKDNLNLVIMPKVGILDNKRESLLEEIENVKNIYRAD